MVDAPLGSPQNTTRIGRHLPARGDVVWWSHRLAEDRRRENAALYCYAAAQHSHVQMTFYFDDAGDLALARRIWRSLREMRLS
jgi:hypothetical protein